MMNKPFKGISVPLATPQRTQYRNGKYPEVGDLVTKEIAAGPIKSPVTPEIRGCLNGFRKVFGVVVSITSGFNNEFQIPLVQWAEYDGAPVVVAPERMELVKRG